MNDAKSPIEITTGNETGDAAASVIWLHGLGASGDDFVPVVPELGLEQADPVRFIFPHAPVQAITINGGMEMPGWFDITSLDFESRQQDLSGMQKSVDIVNGLIDKEIARGVPSERIVIAGFSQGGAIALLSALNSKLKLAGVMALSTYLPDAGNALATFRQNHDERPLPIFMAHGQYDDVIQIRFAEASRDALQTASMNLEWHSYPMPHSVSAEEIRDIASWLRQVLAL